MIDKDYKTEDSKERRETMPTKKTVNYDLLSEVKEVLKDKTKLAPYVVPMLELIKEKNEATSTAENLLNLEECYKKRMEKLKGPKKIAGTSVPC